MTPPPHCRSACDNTRGRGEVDSRGLGNSLYTVHARFFLKLSGEFSVTFPLLLWGKGEGGDGGYLQWLRAAFGSGQSLASLQSIEQLLDSTQAWVRHGSHCLYLPQENSVGPAETGHKVRDTPLRPGQGAAPTVCISHSSTP